MSDTLQSNILRFVKVYTENNRQAPHSIHQIAVCLGEGEQSVYREVHRMVDMGILEREQGYGSPILINGELE
jgi:predicted transcriptional regulator